MKRYIVYVKLVNGQIEQYQTFANSEGEAEKRILAFCKDVVKIQAFDYMIQFA